MLVDHQDDVYIGGLHFANARTDRPNAYFFFFNQNYPQNRITFFEDKFTNIGTGTVGTENPAAITLYNPATTIRKYFTLMGCSLDDYSVPILDTFALSYGVVENNTILKGKTAIAGQGFFLKSDLQNFSIRRNTSVSQHFVEGAVKFQMQSQVFPNDNVELCYNLLIDPSGGTLKSGYEYELIYGYGPKGKNGYPHFYSYRNTIVGSISVGENFPYSATIENNVVINPQNRLQFNYTGANQDLTESNNLVGTASSGIIDPNGRLIGTFSSYQGKRGYEISTGIIPLSFPVWQ